MKTLLPTKGSPFCTCKYDETTKTTYQAAKSLEPCSFHQVWKNIELAAAASKAPTDTHCQHGYAHWGQCPTCNGPTIDHGPQLTAPAPDGLLEVEPITEDALLDLIGQAANAHTDTMVVSVNDILGMALRLGKAESAAGDAAYDEVKPGPTVFWCIDHARPGGSTNCLMCACEELSNALAAIDEMLIEADSNGAKVTPYDLDADPNGVVQRVREQVDLFARHIHYVHDNIEKNGRQAYDSLIEIADLRAQVEWHNEVIKLWIESGQAPPEAVALWKRQGRPIAPGLESDTVVDAARALLTRLGEEDVPCIVCQRPEGLHTRECQIWLLEGAVDSIIGPHRPCECSGHKIHPFGKVRECEYFEHHCDECHKAGLCTMGCPVVD